jgi:hypothetical protein
LIEVVRRDTNNVFIEAHIADIHFGSFDPAKQFIILKEQFLDYIEQLPILDIVSINGDIFDHKFMANSDAVMYACNFIELLINICKEKNATLIIIAGTALHDADQLKLFYHYLGRGTDIRIVERVQFEYIKGKSILIIPELYNMGSAYYNQFLNSGYYDACYMHGAYKGAIFGKDEPDLDSTREPVFGMKNFMYCKGPVISGHVHTPGCFDKHFYYCGSPYRWRFGEEEEKGFIILLHNTETMQYYTHFEPIKSFRYDTVNLDSMLSADPQQVIEYIKHKKAEGIDNIRVQFTHNEEEKLAIIKAYFRNYPGVKIDANFKNEAVVEETTKLNDQYQQYGFIFDKSATPFEILAKYINMQEGNAFITSDELISIFEEEL